MFPSVSIGLKGLEQDAHYCLLLEMLPIGECRFKYSGSQWLPAGGAEPQSPQRIFLHPDSPANGAHWESQSIAFNKIKLTNNTLDNNGHIVLASMHKYQPRVHVIKTKDLTELPWVPQKSFLFPETEFIAVTAYQNDRITKLKIDNNPFAKGFRETGQSKCKRKLMANNSSYTNSSSPSLSNDDTEDDSGSTTSTDTMGKKLRCIATSHLNVPDDAIYKCLAMDQFYLRPPPPFHTMPSKFITNIDTYYTDTAADNVPMFNDFCSPEITMPLASPYANPSSYFTANYSDKSEAIDGCQTKNDNKATANCSNNIDDQNTNRACLESTAITTKPANNTKKSNFSISAILAY